MIFSVAQTVLCELFTPERYYISRSLVVSLRGCAHAAGLEGGRGMCGAPGHRPAPCVSVGVGCAATMPDCYEAFAPLEACGYGLYQSLNH